MFLVTVAVCKPGARYFILVVFSVGFATLHIILVVAVDCVAQHHSVIGEGVPIRQDVPEQLLGKDSGIGAVTHAVALGAFGLIELWQRRRRRGK